MLKASNNLSRPASSVNLQSRAQTPEVSLNSQEKRVANLPISKNLDALEETLNILLSSISKYNPNIEASRELVRINNELQDSVNAIITHQQSGFEIESLEEKSSKLDNDTVKILLGLNECRKKLSALPTLGKVLQEQKQMESNRIKTDDLLTYAMKLAKFTTAPPTFDSGTIGPNNFIWPAEDSLRRGMLAIAALNADKLTGNDNNNDSEQNSGGNDINTEQDDTSGRVGASPQYNQRRNSFGGSYGDGDVSGINDALDLDLFDPDDL